MHGWAQTMQVEVAGRPLVHKADPAIGHAHCYLFPFHALVVRAQGRQVWSEAGMRSSTEGCGRQDGRQLCRAPALCMRDLGRRGGGRMQRPVKREGEGSHRLSTRHTSQLLQS
jgi:hypothetical protein